MRLPVACAVWLVLGIAACDTPPTEPKPETENPSEVSRTDPVRAREQSPNCPNRCGYALDVGMPSARLLGLMENATLFGASNRTPFLWHAQRGGRVLPAKAPESGGQVSVIAVSDWGQMAGVYITPEGGASAMAWEPDGTPVYVTAGPGGARIEGFSRALNENSVIVGEGRPSGDLGVSRAFRSHYRDGFRWLTAAGVESRAADVNFSGAVVGEYWPNPNTIHAFLWTPGGGFQDLGQGRATAISETGYVVGMRFGSPARGFLRTPQGETLLLEPGWQPIDVNHWGEVLLQGHPAGMQTECKIGVWYRGYGLLELSSPVADSPYCYVSSINSWGDVAGGVFKDVPSSEYGGRTRVFTPVLWTWQGNAHRYAR